MSAFYPGATRPFTAKTDLVDHVEADDVNSLQEEVVAIENTLGTSPQVSTSPNPVSTFVSTSTNYANLAVRLANIEIGIVADAHGMYVHNTGGDVITSLSNSISPIVVHAKAGSTVDTFRVESSSGAPWFNVDQNGNTFIMGQSAPVGRVSSAKTQINAGPGTGGAEWLFPAYSNVFTFVNGRKYRCTLQAVFGDSANVGAAYVLRLRDGTGTGSPLIAAMPSTDVILSSGVGGSAVGATFYLDNLSAGAHNINITIQSTGAGAMQALQSSSNPGYMWVEDIGT